MIEEVGRDLKSDAVREIEDVENMKDSVAQITASS